MLTQLPVMGQIAEVEDDGTCIEQLTDVTSLTEAQEAASVYEKSMWVRHGTVRDGNRFWRSASGHLVAPFHFTTIYN